MNLKATLASIRAALRRRGATAQDADDLVQEAWIRLASYMSDTPVERPEAFMMRAALNLAIDAHRMRVAHGEEVLVEDVVLLDTAPDAEAALLAKEQVRRLSEGVNRLPDKTRSIFLSHRLDGLPYSEIARLHGLSITTVHSHVAKAALQLTRWMNGW
jgi:RNA polymerase sigma factor (sigma-70 family)